MTKELCKTIVDNAFEIGGKKFANIPLGELAVDHDYQRNTGSKLKQLIEDWDIRKCDVLIVSYRDDKFYVLDGQHRWQAAMKNEVQSLPCQIHVGFSKIDEAKCFAYQDANVTKLTPFDTFKANQVIGDRVDKGILRLCEKYEITVKKPHGRMVANLGAITIARLFYKVHGSVGLEWAFDILKKSNWHNCPGAYSEKTLIAMYFLYGEFKDVATDAKIAAIEELKERTPYSYKISARSEYLECRDCDAIYRKMSSAINNQMNHQDVEEIEVRDSLSPVATAMPLQ
ncbi:MAG: ParB/Srx family N-terminal domain-containing protein [Rikenellaceae bacterium]